MSNNQSPRAGDGTPAGYVLVPLDVLQRCRDTAIPLGTLADEELRRARKVCKQPFERVWQSGLMTRTEAYTRIAKHLDIPIEQCHFGLFDERQCYVALNWAVARLKGRPISDGFPAPGVEPPMIHSVAFALGYLLLILGGMTAGALLILAVAKLFNRAMWALVDCYGGVKVFDEFRRWHRANRPYNRT